MYVPTNLHKRIRSHSVFIVDRDSKEMGSGVLVSLRDKVFVFSAAHVIRGDIDISLGLDTPETRFTILNKWIDTDQDIGFLELKPFEVQILRVDDSVPFAIGGSKKGEIPTKKATLALCGFPVAHKEQRETHTAFPVFYQTVAILAPEQWPEPLNRKWHSDYNFLILYGPKRGARMLDVEEQPMEPADPHGLSGSGLWYFDPETELLERPTYSLVGVQHSYDEFYQVLMGTFIQKLITAISEQYGFDFSPS